MLKRLLLEGRDVLLALAPALRDLKDDIYKRYILRILIAGDLTLDVIKDKLRREHSISLNGLILEQFLRELGREGLIESTGLYFRMKQKGQDLIKSLNRSQEEEFGQIINIIASKVPEKYKKEVLSRWKDVLSDIIQSFGEIVDEYFYDVFSSENVYSAVESLAGSKPEPKCRMKGITEDLRCALQQAYKEIWTMRDSPASQVLLNNALFWRAFLRIISYSDTARRRLVQELGITTLLLDTNTLIAWSCDYHPLHGQAVRHIKFLTDTLKVRLYYTKQTIKELQRHIDPVERAVRFLQNYPERAPSIAFRTGHPILQAFFREGYISWESYFNGFMRNIRRHFEEFGIESHMISPEEVQKLTNTLLPKVSEIMEKTPMIARHDASLLALVKKLRESHKDWFKLVDWILTTDLRLFRWDRYLWENREPTSIFLTRVPYYFYVFSIAKAVDTAMKETMTEEITFTHDVLLDALITIKRWGADMSAQINAISRIKESELDNKLLEQTTKLLKVVGE